MQEPSISRNSTLMSHCETPLPTRMRIVTPAIFCLSLLLCLHATEMRIGLSAPPENGGDSDDYERLGYNLVSGQGFGFCAADLPVRAGLAEPPVVSVCEPLCSAEEFELTAYRPPGFPILIAAVYQFSPLNFLAIRIINCIFCAMAVTLISVVVARQTTTMTGILSAVACSVDSRFREMAGTFLTENMAMLALCVMTISLSCLCRKFSFRNAVCSGLALSWLVVVRSFYVSWYPCLWLLIGYLAWRSVKSGSLSSGSAARIAVSFWVCSLVLTGPWWIRNCLVLDAWMPTGTQGGICFADGFSDSAMANFGSWTPTVANSVGAELRADASFHAKSQLEFEREHCRRCTKRALNWIYEHPELLPRLSWWKFSRLWEIGSPLHGILFATCGVGLWFGRKLPLFRIMCLLMLLNTLTVLATYHTYERFLTPFRPMLHAMSAYALVSLGAMLAGRLGLIKQGSKADSLVS